MREPASVRRPAETMLAARWIPVMLVVLGLGTVGTLVPPGTPAPAEAGPEQEVQPLPRWAHSAAVVNGKIYVMGGVGADNQQLVARVEVYDPATRSWAARAGIPTPRALLGASTVGGKIYAIGGTTMGLDGLAVVEAYDPATNTWTRRADMPTPRNSLSTAVVAGKIYAVGGMRFDRPDGGWESVDPTVGGKAFSTVESYDPETDVWVAGEDMPTPRAGVTVSAVGGKIYAIGGGTRRGERDVSLSLVEVFDTATNRWAPSAGMPTPRMFPCSAVVDGRIYATGGVTSLGPASSQTERMRNRVPLSVVEVLDPASGSWSTDANLATARGWHSTSFVDSRLFVIGGRGPAQDGGILEVDGALPGMEIYTPPRRPR